MLDWNATDFFLLAISLVVLKYLQTFLAFLFRSKVIRDNTI